MDNIPYSVLIADIFSEYPNRYFTVAALREIIKKNIGYEPSKSSIINAIQQNMYGNENLFKCIKRTGEKRVYAQHFINYKNK